MAKKHRPDNPRLSGPLFVSDLHEKLTDEQIAANEGLREACIRTDQEEPLDLGERDPTELDEDEPADVDGPPDAPTA